MNDMPRSIVDGFRRVCDERKYAIFGTELYRKLLSSSLSCQMVSIPGTSYPDRMSFIISKTSNYKRLVNGR